jgi:predicted lipase
MAIESRISYSSLRRSHFVGAVFREKKMSQELPIHEAWQHINSIDWHESGFDIKKAYVCALFSELTYYRIPDFELRDADRVNVIPCLAYQQAVREGRSLDFDQLMRSLDFGQFFVVIRRYAIVVGVRTPNMIIIAIRGTKYLYDWGVNLRASKHIIRERYHFEDFGEVGFHSGFFRAVFGCFEPVSREIRKFNLGDQDATPIYVTGHSLGGALAAIMHVVWSREYPKVHAFPGNILFAAKTDASYTFGMPRYGDMRAVTQYATPYHLYNELDIVPTVPPKWLGFENCFSEFKLDGTSLQNVQGRESVRFASWLTRLMTGKGVANHAMEIYRERIREAF